MPKNTLGITATELFACNPYRILGVPVDSTAEEIERIYNKLMSMASTGEIDSYRSDFDFASLPPFKRDEQTLKTAYIKLASTGYKCFAYADKTFSTALNIDDVALNLEDITCYDCFLRCYMWLVTNDRNFEEESLWVSLCKYIDKMIVSSPEEWKKYFDHRFPSNLNDDKLTSLKSFYTTFCDIILLPIKEMVRGSMKCRTSIDILKVVGIDVDQKFEKIDIPQANKPKAGEPAPKLKIAVKDGEEYYDVKEGKMVSFEAANENKVENNSFTAASTSISADAIVGETAPTKEDAAPIKKTVATPPQINSSAFVKPSEPKVEKKAENVAPEVKLTNDDLVMPVRKHKVIIPAEDKEPAKSFDTVNSGVLKFDPKNLENLEPTEKTDDEQTEEKSESRSDRSKVSSTPESKFTNNGSAVQNPTNVNQTPISFKRTRGGLSSILESVDNASADIDFEEEEETNQYQDLLIKMLRSNRSAAVMKSVDTKHIYDNGDSNLEKQESDPSQDVSMDPINMKRYDKRLLNSNFDEMQDLDPKKAREAKYRDISVNDMINPTMGKGGKLSTEFQPDPIEVFKKNKQKQKQFRITMWKTVGLAAIIICILLILYLTGIF